MTVLLWHDNITLCVAQTRHPRLDLLAVKNAASKNLDILRNKDWPSLLQTEQVHGQRARGESVGFVFD